MASNNRLYRNFVILQEDERGYANSEDKTLSGYSKIEAKGDKCKISFYAQNLKKDNDKYYMVLICSKKDIKQIVNLGPLEVTDKGKGEVTKEFNVSNIAGLNLDFDKISGAAIVKMNNDSPIFVMCGFLNGQQPTDNWKGYTIIKTRDVRSTKSNIIKDSKKEIKKNDSKKRKVKEESLSENEAKEEEKPIIENPIRDEVEVKIEPEETKKEFAESEESEIIKENEPKENLRGKFEDYEDKIEANKEFDPINGKIRGSIGEYFESIVDGFERDTDSIDELKYTKWYKVPVHDLREMCNMNNYNKYTLAYYPMLNYYPYIKKYGFFMIGYKCDSKGNLKHIIYGVPGKKDKDEQPYDGRTGFVTWVSIKNNANNGCWLMFYDFKNSTVVVPMK
ncbi:hypothetical protein [uncultured Clostridium sp.]|uniref:DUF7922 domain-containing protein n=1 Tax=uncultured Clostridium sp. TaxID=59620 RepID=UPI002671A7E3|nr:hypothetical protein [uncultured Clostridium sp.]MBS4973013.1 hypothetical protein [Clostridium celatum]